MNYDELEESLTLSELIETYIGLREKDNRLLEGMAAMWGAKPKEDGSKLNLDQKTDPKDIVEEPVSTAAGDKFGVGFGLGHTEIQ